MIDFKGLSKKYSSSRFSSFWDDTSDTSIVDDFLNDGNDDVIEKKSRKKDIIQLSSYRRAISNFVNIVTGQNVPVKFVTRGDSYTDGKEVTISSTLNDRNFDSAVGLALHEGSHIKLTDFNFDYITNIPKELFVLAEGKGYHEERVKSQIKDLLNWVEDRRIDRYIISTSPGYKGYYHSMYDKYFHSKNIDNGLISDVCRDETWDSYIFRIINIINKKRQFNALKGLKEIWNVLDLKNISRLKNTEDSFGVACDIYRIVMRNIDKLDVEEQKNGGGNSGNGGEDDSSNNDNTLSDEQFKDLLDDVENGNMNGSDDSSMGSSGNSTKVDVGDVPMGSMNNNPQNDSVNDDGKPTKKLSDRQKQLLEKAIEKQKDFLDGDIKKTQLTKKDSRDIKAIEESGATYEQVGYENSSDYYGRAGKTKCLVIKKLTKGLIDSNQFGFARAWNGESYDSQSRWRNYNFVEEGIRLGKILGRKLKVRSEEKSTKYSRKNTGKIDKRLISELGFSNENVFEQTFIDRYNKAYLHISIDASGSMCGDKWNRAMTSAVAMTKACDMAGNIDVIVSIRATHGQHHSAEAPAILICYDSRVDKFNKVKNMFKYLDANGTTPEGLCFEAIIKDFIPGNNNQESYFINYSDGQPYYGNNEIYYSGHSAECHTRKQVNNIRGMGINVLSYFIGGEYDYESEHQSFKNMYGKDAEFINATNMMDVARTMNKKFLQKKGA